MTNDETPSVEFLEHLAAEFARVERDVARDAATRSHLRRSLLLRSGTPRCVWSASPLRHVRRGGSRSADRRSRLRQVALIAVSAGLASSAAVVAIAASIDGAQVPQEEGGVVSKRHVVVTGTDPEFGRYRVLLSTTTSGKQCLGLHRPDAYADLPPEALVDKPKVNGDLAESCGSEVSQMMTLFGNRRSMLVGSLPAGAVDATLSVGGQAPRRLQLTPDPTTGRQIYAESFGVARFAGAVVQATGRDGQRFEHRLETPSP